VPIAVYGQQPGAGELVGQGDRVRVRRGRVHGVAEQQNRARFVHPGERRPEGTRPLVGQLGRRRPCRERAGAYGRLTAQVQEGLHGLRISDIATFTQVRRQGPLRVSAIGSMLPSKTMCPTLAGNRFA
jgi:hypothetical protein